MKSIYEQIGGSYVLAEDGMYYPAIKLDANSDVSIGKYGRMRRQYLKEYRPVVFTQMVLNGTLFEHLKEIDDSAHNRLHLIIEQMAERQGIDEALKSSNQMAWVQTMNNIRNAAEEIILSELILA